MERHMIRRIPVLDEHDRCVGIIGQADLAWAARGTDVVKLLRDVSRDTDQPSR
jgi:CBS-domain-containing membrane protein